ncbi:MAG: hypothetical protein PHT83_00735 [Bacilli bacterium]|nr:hypothetical protein [Bacilli bacterium]
MRKKAFILLLIIIVINLVATSAYSSYLTYNVTVEAFFDDYNHIVVDSLNVKYKTNVSLMENCDLDFTNYEFKYWLIDDYIVSQDMNYEIEITKNTKATAIYKPSDKIVVVFVDDNNYVLQVAYFDSGDTFEQDDYYDERLLSKVGYRFSDWYLNDEVFEASVLTSDIIIKAAYKPLDKRNPYRLVVFGGNIPSGQSYYPFGQIVTIVADDDPIDKEFIYWVDEFGNIVSPSRRFRFMIINDIRLTAVFGDVGSRVEEPFININVVTSVIEAKKISYVNQFYFPLNSNFQFIEVGMLMLKTNENVDINLLEFDSSFRVKDPRVVRGSALSISPYNEFLMSKVNVEIDDIWYGRSYIIYEEVGIIKVKYSLIMIKVKEISGGKEIL